MHERVLSFDEKTSLQPRTRTVPTRPARPGLVPVHLEHEYQRKGALQLFAAFDTRGGEVTGAGPSVAEEASSIPHALHARALLVDEPSGTVVLDPAAQARMPFDHERLEVYQVALEFFDVADVIVEQLRHHGGRSNLADQLGRAALSIVNNIAEGAGRISKPDKSRFYGL